MRKVNLELTTKGIKEVLNLIKNSELSDEEKISIRKSLIDELERLELDSESSFEHFCNAHELLETIDGIGS